MPTPQEPDFQPGHPARFDYDPKSPEAQEWARRNFFPKGERDFPPGHPKAIDTPGNTNHVRHVAGVDPSRPDHEPFTGRSPEQAAAARELYQQRAQQAVETPEARPVMANNPAREQGLQRVLQSGDGTAYTIFCPGCECGHVFDKRWAFNGSMTLPTFDKSMMVNRDDPKTRCHSFVSNGRIQFLPDSGHKLSGQTVDLPPVSALQETIDASRP